MNRSSRKERRHELFMIAVGCVLYALSMTMVEPVELIPGSFLGLAVVMHKLLNTPTGAVNLIMNIPIMILCVKIFGRKMLYYTVIIMIATAVLIDLFRPFAPEAVYMPPVLIALFGGCVMGAGAGLLLAAGGTMAGTTALARIVNRRYPKISVGNALIIMDTVILLAGCLILHSISALLYSVLYTLACSKTIDLVLLMVRKVMTDGTRQQTAI